MPVEDVFSITGRGTVATGRVERGSLKVGEEVEIVGLTEEKRKVVVTGIEMFRKLLDVAETGDNIGALLRGVQRDEIERGQVLAAQMCIRDRCKEHDHRSCTDGRSDPGSSSDRRTDAADKRTHSAVETGRSTVYHRIPEQVRYGR